MALHPSVAAVRRAVRRSLDDLASGDTVLVACSGGPDSLALLAATLHEGHRAGLRVVGGTIDHGLQEGSDEHARRLVGTMAALGCDETISSRVVVESSGTGPEDAARRARYAVLEQMAAHLRASAVLLGHTRDDQAETVLLGLARGSGGRAIAGMRAGFGPFRRPLLGVARDDTVTACQVEGLEPWHDPHNDDPGYARVRVRRRVLPVLEDQLGPGVAAALARTAEQLRHDVELLDDLADELLTRLVDVEGRVVTAAVDGLAAQPTALRRRVLRLMALRAGAPASETFHEHVVALDALLTDWRGQRWIDLPGPVRGRRVDGRLEVGPAPSTEP
ncbi:tRNA lysidine(34) synthetase TilS [Nocardioides sp. TRM66260-LWL]|uniref:tRNA lysidine(34) synthetase TilS n=1 Tax=Nocardioides sp. TRM66260-LWL TaxID=2874478 RepID=UPI001CC562A0|nr:tRNA lysidine(34) synthetase TilS [Nocardioides sp. TRM66260-LWL]MBZ5734843.1 tRNA lysidine(34) synthetase TilS [Nocardioides sp. TRM66260-LWL]